MNTATSILEIIPAVEANAAPGKWVSYYELAKPRMNMLILGTTFVGFFMAGKMPGDFWKLPQTLLGTALCAASAAVLNQLMECKYDALMPRTARRPLPTGRVSRGEALAIGLAAGIAGGIVLAIFVNILTAILGIATLGSYVLLYTPMKRLTTMNTIVGAIPGAIPPVMGWTAVTGVISPPALALFAILFLWQIPHFLAIAILYREDYRKGGFARDGPADSAVYRCPAAGEFTSSDDRSGGTAVPDFRGDTVARLFHLRRQMRRHAQPPRCAETLFRLDHLSARAADDDDAESGLRCSSAAYRSSFYR
jgi:protoheme IX farnesyltransferase